MNTHQKVASSHLKRDAYLYIRQSTLKQVLENQESTKRQYDLRERAVQLGWPLERVIVIDSDLGQSGAHAIDRSGFQQLVAEVGMGRAGIVMGLEVSRLARNSTDWHRLLEICALSQTLILDEDGIYDPSHFNDRLLLGLKGTMSEAELHVLRARLRGGILNKARRGELQTPLPVGLIFDTTSARVMLDPDKQVQESVRLFFQIFQRTGSATGTVKYFRKNNIRFPRRLRTGTNKGKLIWGEMIHSRALQILHNPRYAGAFVFGRLQGKLRPDGTYGIQKLPRNQWHTLILDAHAGYISWQEYEANLSSLRENAHANGADRRRSPPREGPALIQGLVLCGFCGNRMTVRYHTRNTRQIPDYLCQRDGIQNGKAICQRVHGAGIDDAIGKLVIDSVTPMALEVALSVQQELSSRSLESDRLRKQSVERARYESDLAQRRYMQVDPENRMVADALEADWNEKLRTLQLTQEEYEKKRKSDLLLIDEEKKKEIMALATDFPRLWRDPATDDRERKRMIRLIIEDVTLINTAVREKIKIHVRFKGGASRSLTIDPPPLAWETRQTHPEVIAEFDQLLDQHTYGEIAKILNERGSKPGMAKKFSPRLINQLRHSYQLKTPYARGRERGLLTRDEIAKKLKVSPLTVNKWRIHGIIKSHKFSDKPEYLYPPPGRNIPKKQQGVKFSKRTVHLSEPKGGVV